MLQFPLPQLHKIVSFPNVSRTLLGIRYIQIFRAYVAVHVIILKPKSAENNEYNYSLYFISVSVLANKECIFL
jgi:hypothetical protein